MYMYDLDPVGGRGGGALVREGKGGGFDTIKIPFFEVFVRSKLHVSNFLSAQGPIFEFLSILGRNFFICPFLAIKMRFSCPLYDVRIGILCPP